MPKKILVVEDDPKAAQALSLRLKSAGYDVLIANDGNEGLILAKSYVPDLVVTDIWMPVGMGFALAYRLREFAPGLPILFVTGNRRPGVKQAVSGFGATRLMEKPYTANELFAAVAEMLKEPAPTRLVQPVALPRPELDSPERGGKRKVLIVEDDRKIGMSLSLRLKSAGYEAFLAPDALIGVTMAVKNPPDLLLLDISMPAGDGFTVAERIQELLPSAIPTIFLTASKQPSFRTKAAEMGAAAFFEKPFKSEELLAAIANAFQAQLETQTNSRTAT